MAMITSTEKASWTNPNQADRPNRGMAKDGWKTSANASTIVVSRTMKPQKINACMRPGPGRWSSLRWASTTVASSATRSGMSSSRSTGWPRRTNR